MWQNPYIWCMTEPYSLVCDWTLLFGVGQNPTLWCMTKTYYVVCDWIPILWCVTEPFYLVCDWTLLFGVWLNPTLWFWNLWCDRTTFFGVEVLCGQQLCLHKRRPGTVLSSNQGTNVDGAILWSYVNVCNIDNTEKWIFILCGCPYITCSLLTK